MASAALKEALRLVETGDRDAVAAMQNHGKLAPLLRRALAEGGGGPTQNGGAELSRTLAQLAAMLKPATSPDLFFAQVEASQIVRVDGIQPLAPNTESRGYALEWPGGGNGFARAMYAGTTDGDVASASRIAVRIAINGSEELFTTGRAAAFIPLVAFHAQNNNWFRLRDIRVDPTQRWIVTFRYEGTAGPPQLTPFLLFAFARDARA